MAQRRRNKGPLSATPLSESPLAELGRLRPGKNRDYKVEYARRKQKAADRGFSSVRRERGARQDEVARRMARGATRPQAQRDLRGPTARHQRDGDVGDMDALEKADYYHLDEFSRSYVMNHWDEFGWFDSWDEAREWYYGTA